MGSGSGGEEFSYGFHFSDETELLDDLEQVIEALRKAYLVGIA